MERLTLRFPPVSKLKKSEEFSNLFNTAFRSVDNQFVVLAKPNDLPQARLGLAISKKRIQLAVNRNRVKRLVRESFRHNQQCLAGLDMVVMAQKGVTSKENKQMTDSLNRHWKKIAQCER